MNNADLIVAALRQAGVERGFGVPSGNVLPLMDAMRRGGIEFVLTAHEGSAGFAADATARLTGTPGLCIATLGPGATNLATGVGCAFLDRSPLIAITCTLDRALLERRIQMRIDHHALFGPITKASLRLEPGRIGATLAAALQIAVSEPAGPVHLELPEDVAIADCAETLPAPGRPAGLPPPAPAALSSAARLIAAARRPVAVIGANALRLRSIALLRRLVERHRLPFATTTMAKGLIDEDHPLAIGCIERACRQLQRGFLRQADLIVGLGYDTIEVEYEAWCGDRPVLHVDIEAADAAPAVRLAAEVTGDLDLALEALLDPAGAPAASCWTEGELGEHRRRFDANLRPPLLARRPPLVARRPPPVAQRRPATAETRSAETPGSPTEEPTAVPLMPHQAIDAVRRALPADGLLAFDVGAHTHQIASQWRVHQPRRFLITNGWSSMGFGLPAAIAAKLARPDLPVACIVGDGCFQMTCGELAAARRHRLPIPFVVLDDGWLSLIKVKQERRELPYYGTALDAGAPAAGGPPEHYFGVPVRAVADAAALEAAVRSALGAAGPTVIEARVDPAHYSETVYD